MNSNEINKELQMNYYDLISYLIQKYGDAVCDFFSTQECESKNKNISRTKEGLYCHHMDEDKGGNLSNPPQAKIQPFEWQKKERLVYCNIIEHLILHFKIAVLRQKDSLLKPNDIDRFFTTGGIFMICKDINDMFMYSSASAPWVKRCFVEIKDNYDDYIILIRALLEYIDEDYFGEKNAPAILVPGNIFHFSPYDCEIVSVTEKRDAFLLKYPTGEMKEFNSFILMDQLTYVDKVDITTRELSSGKKDFCERIYNDIIKCDKKEEIKNYANLLKINYRGYGYSQYASIKLSEEFGANNADQYISKALPMHCNTIIELEGKTPVFWRGSEIPPEATHCFFIVRLETMFSVKKGIKPFVRYRESNLSRNMSVCRTSETNNLKDIGWTVLSTSDIYYEKTGKYYSKYVDFDGRTKDATVILSLGTDDYLLFRKQYNIRYLKVIDGCYFY